MLCSATLTVEHRFDYIASRLGISISSDADAGSFRGLTLPSPFDYKQQSKVILTNHLPIPIPVNEREFCEEMAADQAGFLSLAGGKTLSLFAARSRMEAIADASGRRPPNLPNAVSSFSYRGNTAGLRCRTGSKPNRERYFTG